MGFGNFISDLKGLVDSVVNVFGGGGDKTYPEKLPGGKGAAEITNFISSYSNKDWKSSRGYAFQVYRVNPDTNAKNQINNDQSKEWKEFRLQINPQELQQDEVFAITVTPTLRGVLVEHHGVTIKDITISGTTGISPLRREAGADPRSGAPLLQSGHSGYEEFHELRSYFRMYAEAKRLDNKDNGELRMVFKNFKDNELLYVEPQKFTMKRSAARPFMYDYTIQLKAIGIANVTPKGADFWSVLGSIDDVLDTAQSYLDSAAGIIQGGIGMLRRVQSDIESTIMNPLRAINAALIAVKSGQGVWADFGITRKFLEKYHAQLREIEDNYNDLIGKTSPVYNELTGHKVTTLVPDGTKPTYPQLQILNGIKSAKLGVTALLAQNETFFEQSVTALNKKTSDLYKSDKGKITFFDPNSVKEVPVYADDDIHTIAARELGDTSKFKDIILLNNLKPPYIDEAGGPGVLKPGDKILLPQQSPSGDSGVIRNKDYNITKGMKEIEKSLGVDIRLDAEGDFALSNVNDTDMIAGIDNMVQAVQLKLYYEKGSLKNHPNIGTNLKIGGKVRDNFAKDLRDEIVQSFASDTRIESVPFIEVVQNGGTAEVNMLVKFRKVEQPVPLPLKLNVG